MINYTELKALAEAALDAQVWCHEHCNIALLELDEAALCRFEAAANPAAILALIAEVDGLKKVSEKLNRERLAAERRYEEQAAARGKLAEEYGRLNYCANICLDERDQLKSELEALRKATGPDYLLRASH